MEYYIENDQLLKVLDGVILKKISEEKQPITLKLYIVDKSRKTENTINRLHENFHSGLMNTYSLEIINIIDNPILAEQEKILATPTLLKISPKPIRRIIGDLSKPDIVLHGLGLANSRELR